MWYSNEAEAFKEGRERGNYFKVRGEMLRQGFMFRLYESDTPYKEYEEMGICHKGPEAYPYSFK